MIAFENIEQFLLDSGKISQYDLKKAAEECSISGITREQLWIQKKLLSENELLCLLSKFLCLKYINLDIDSIDLSLSSMVPEFMAVKYNSAPVGMENDKLILAMAYPFNPYSADDISFASGHEVEPVLSLKVQVENAIKVIYGEHNEKEKNIRAVSSAKIKNIEEGSDTAPAVNMLNTILLRAIESRASDIHIEPFEDYVRVRFRVDGELRNEQDIVKNTQLISRIKVMANLNIAEKRIPQEGRIFINIGDDDYDLRVSIMPVAYGEKAAIRILKRRNFLMSKEELGFKRCDLEKIESMIRMHYGIILITGPTGSGKSTTLYTLLNELNDGKRNIVTIEDPVEYMIKGINQMNINTKLELTFASGLRSILRQDPDVIMIGEIRDPETAEIAVRAAITGHLVFSTLHTGDASEVIIRLMEMGVKPFLIYSTLIGSIAQRLVKRICPECKYGYPAGIYEKSILGINGDQDQVIYKGRGCSFCGYTGYYSRIAVYEIIDFKRGSTNFYQYGNDSYEIARALKAMDFKTLKQNCIELVTEGITTVDELVRVIYE